MLNSICHYYLWGEILTQSYSSDNQRENCWLGKSLHGSEKAGMIGHCMQVGEMMQTEKTKVGALHGYGIVGVNQAPAAPALLEGSPPKEKETRLPRRESCLFCN